MNKAEIEKMLSGGCRNCDCEVFIWDKDLATCRDCGFSYPDGVPTPPPVEENNEAEADGAATSGESYGAEETVGTD